MRHLFISYSFAEMLTCWLISYVRLLRPPALYYISTDYYEDDFSLIQKCAGIIHSAAALLEKCNLLKDECVRLLVQYELDRITSHYYITYNPIYMSNE